MKIYYSKIWLFAVISTAGIFANHSVLAKTEIKFNEPEKFQDVLVTGSNKSRSINKINKELSELFEQLSKNYITDNETLLIEVTDLDLAGYIEPMVGPNHEDIRIVRSSDHYRLSFNYEVKNEKGEIKQKGEKEIKNFVSQGLTKRLSNNNSVSHFEKDLKKWFEENSFK